MDQSVKIQLPSAEDGEESLRNIWFNNVSDVEQLKFLAVLYKFIPLLHVCLMTFASLPVSCTCILASIEIFCMYAEFLLLFITWCRHTVFL